MNSWIIPRRFLPAILLLSSILLLLIFYCPGLSGDFFVIDDSSLISIPLLKLPLSLSFLKILFSPGHHIDFYPMRDFSYWMDIHLLGADQTGADGFVYRIENIVLVFFSAVFIYRIFKLLGVDDFIASTLAAFWILHPFHSELLMWPSARKDCLALCFTLASAYFVISGQRQRNNIWKFFAIFMYFLGLLSKTLAALLPLCLPIGLFFRKRREPYRKGDWVFISVLVFSGLLWVGIQAHFYSTGNDMTYHYSILYRIKGSLDAFGRGVIGVFFPSLNAVDVEKWGDWAERNLKYLPVGVISFLLLIGWTFFSFIRRQNDIFLGLTAFWLLYLPISGLIFPHRNFYSVRYFEGPFICLYFLIAPRIVNALQRKPPIFLRSISAGIFIALILGAWNEATVWADPVGPFKKALALDATNPSLLRMSYDVLLNEQRWGRLDKQSLEWKDQIKNQLQIDCGARTLQENFRNSHLCGGIWQREIIRSDEISIDGDVFELASKSLESVNSTLLKRLTLTYHLSNELKSQGHIDASELKAYRDTYPINSPQRQTDLWAYTCLSGNEKAAKSLLKQSMIDSVIETQGVMDTLIDLKKRYPKTVEQLSKCR